MSNKIPEKYLDLLQNPNIVSFSTVTPDGEPNTSPVWASYDGKYVLINTAKGRKKDKNVQTNPNVAVMVFDPTNPYRYLEIRGFVEEMTEEGAVEHINFLAKKYTGKDQYYGNMSPLERASQETRVIYKVKPVNVIGQG